VVRAGFRAQRSSTGGGGLSVLTPEAGGEVTIAIDYGYWDLRWWLPRTMVARGIVNIGGMRLPLSYERQYDGYTIEGDPAPLDGATAAASERPCRPSTFVSIEATIGGEPADSLWDRGWESSAARVAEADSASLESGRRCDRSFLVSIPDEVDLIASDFFRTSIYDEDEAVAGEEEMRQLMELLRRIPQPPVGIGSPSVQLLPPELFRFNRVEGISGGARAVLPLGAVALTAELRGGTTGEVGGRFGVSRSTFGLRTELAAYRGIEAVEVAAQPFSLPASVAAFALGRDENDYFRGTGVEVRTSPGVLQRQSWDLRLFAERQSPVSARSDFSLRGMVDGGFEPRANIEAERLNQAGAGLRLRTRIGSDDPARVRAGGELELQGEVGDRTFSRPSLRLDGSVPFGTRSGVAMALAGGTAFGQIPTQRIWQVGGAGTVRGHDPAALRGDTFWMARAELFRGSPALRVGIFGDAGWAGERGRLLGESPIRGLGAGVSLLDNLVRLDLARGIGGGGFRLHLRMGGGL
jgi:hypothetical protein